jgi:hypothetical protein
MIYLMLTYRACNVEPYAYLIQALSEFPQRALDIDVTGLLSFNFRTATASPRRTLDPISVLTRSLPRGHLSPVCQIERLC